MSPLRRASGDAEAAIEMRRFIVQALGLTDWSLGTLVNVAGRVQPDDWPEGAEGARVGVIRALDGGGNLRLQLLGAFAVPGWRSGTLRSVAGVLLAGAPSFAGEEIEALRAAYLGLGRPA